jgi:hypothetical protein
MKRQEAPPDGSVLSRPASGFRPAVEDRLEDDELGIWSQEYLEVPARERIGVCCSGGGIRSASYCLGALQVLDEAKVLEATEYLAAVSGGDYLAVARTAAVATTFGDFWTGKSANQAPELPQDLILVPCSFATISPFGPNSPDERNLRDYSSYLARGINGKLWLGMNVIYGAVRHLLPFVALLFLLAAAIGFGFNRWIGKSLHADASIDWKLVILNLQIAGGIAGVGVISLTVRQFVASSQRPSGTTLAALQGLSLLMLRAALLVAAILAGLPALLRLLSFGDTWQDTWLPAGAAGGTAAAFSSAYVYLTQRGQLKRLLTYLRLVLPLAGFVVVVIPFVGFTYWVTQQGFHLRQTATDQAGPFYAFLAAIVIVVGFSFLNEVTPSMHLFYREKLAKAFIGMRVRDTKTGELSWAEPPWRIPLSFSKVRDHSGVGAKLPKLVVCASVNASDESIPLGRNAGPFTFEQDYSGSPLTGYLPTRDLEAAAGEEVLTMPAMMAIAGAALSPTMGKMTRPAMRLLMALFNVRLGVWLPNPCWLDSLSAADCRRGYPRKSAASRGPDVRLRRPGMLYILREALGLNSLRQRYVYITDGGHFENLGLVELMRRGCGQIVCFDAAGDDLTHFHTISEAIALARSDLGVEIKIDLKDLMPGANEVGNDISFRDAKPGPKEESKSKPKAKGVSKSDHVSASIRYPNGETGILVFAKAAMSKDAPQDARAFQEVDPDFPHHSTADQFFDERKFESYRGLGAHAARGCVDVLNEYRRKKNYPLFQLEPIPPPP